MFTGRGLSHAFLEGSKGCVIPVSPGQVCCFFIRHVGAGPYERNLESSFDSSQLAKKKKKKTPPPNWAEFQVWGSSGHHEANPELNVASF